MELTLGITLILKTPYRMTLIELQKLNKYL